MLTVASKEDEHDIGDGVISKHSYAVLDIKSINNEKTKKIDYFVKLSNPIQTFSYVYI